LFLLITSLVVLSVSYIDSAAFVFIFFFVLIYMCLFLIGVLFRKGPLKGVGIGVLLDREEELKELEPPKQPWE